MLPLIRAPWNPCYRCDNRKCFDIVRFLCHGFSHLAPASTSSCKVSKTISDWRWWWEKDLNGENTMVWRCFHLNYRMQFINVKWYKLRSVSYTWASRLSFQFSLHLFVFDFVYDFTNFSGDFPWMLSKRKNIELCNVILMNYENSRKLINWNHIKISQWFQCLFIINSMKSSKLFPSLFAHYYLTSLTSPSQFNSENRDWHIFQWSNMTHRMLTPVTDIPNDYKSSFK